MPTREDQRYEISAPDAAGEVIDGEAIILNLRRGHYFSAEGCGAFIWAAIEARATPAEIAARLAARTGTAIDATREAVSAFVTELLAHELVRPSDAGAEAAWDWPGELAFVAPRLEVYTDMQDIMQLDPIHDVDARGWPIAPSVAA